MRSVGEASLPNIIKLRKSSFIKNILIKNSRYGKLMLPNELNDFFHTDKYVFFLWKNTYSSFAYFVVWNYGSFGDNRSCVFYCVASAAHFLFLGAFVMSKIDTARELYCYKKMYHLMQKAVINCVEICQDPIVKQKLINAQQDAEDIYTGEEYIGKALTAEEMVIVLLLSYIREREISKGIGLMDGSAVEEAVDWVNALQGVNIELSDEMIEEQINKIFHSNNSHDMPNV